MKTEKLDTKIRQEQIAQAALRLVAAGGMKELSIANIAKEVGVVPSALYRHYKNKDAVLGAVLELVQSRLMSNVRSVQRGTTDPIEKLHKLLMRHIKLIGENRGIPRVVFSEDIYSGSEIRRKQIYAIISEYLEKIEEIVVQGQLSGAIRKELKAKNIALIFFGLIQPSAVLWHLSGGLLDIAEQAEKNWAIIEDTLKTGTYSKAN